MLCRQLLPEAGISAGQKRGVIGSEKPGLVEDTMAEETDGRRQGNPAAALALCAVSAFIFYIVSPVPVVYLLNHSTAHGGARRTIQRLCSPFAWAREHTRLRKPIDRYGQFLNRV